MNNRQADFLLLMLINLLLTITKIFQNVTTILFDSEKLILHCIKNYFDPLRTNFLFVWHLCLRVYISFLLLRIFYTPYDSSLPVFPYHFLFSLQSSKKSIGNGSLFLYSKKLLFFLEKQHGICTYVSMKHKVMSLKKIETFQGQSKEQFVLKYPGDRGKQFKISCVTVTRNGREKITIIDHQRDNGF